MLIYQVVKLCEHLLAVFEIRVMPVLWKLTLFVSLAYQHISMRHLYGAWHCHYLSGVVPWAVGDADGHAAIHRRFQFHWVSALRQTEVRTLRELLGVVSVLLLICIALKCWFVKLLPLLVGEDLQLTANKKSGTLVCVFTFIRLRVNVCTRIHYIKACNTSTKKKHR